ncbi:hypothetical protein [Microlunatus parietis]|uniref:Uncharacterized protein n=1 Tax=Microlunatus parietis TaxID=682979 RepID=A0A7Y9LC97_9ACTN|nr:hypothetical protein [Microlunatus parietis]NYE74624.1 hypothetical protein [Microlunatus parietis]
MSAPKARSPKPMPTPRLPWQPPLAVLIIAIALPAVAGVLLAWANSVPGSQVIMGVIGVGLSLVAASFLVINGIICFARRTLVPAVIIGAVILVGLFVFAESGLPLRARFELHRAAFDEVAGQPLPPKEGVWQGPCPTRIGNFPISRCAAIGTGFLYYEPEGGLLNGAGFAYLPEGPERAQRPLADDPTADLSGRIVYRPLAGDWYSFIDPAW